MSAEAHVRFDAVVVDERVGLWCERCALPSATRIEAVLVLITDDGVNELARRVARSCENEHS